MIHSLVSERIGLRHVFIVGAVGRLALLGKHHRHIVQVAKQGSNGNATSLDGQHLVHLNAFKSTLKLVGHLTDDINVDLMVEEIVNFQEVSRLNDAICYDFFFEEIHVVQYL